MRMKKYDAEINKRLQEQGIAPPKTEDELPPEIEKEKEKGNLMGNATPTPPKITKI